MSNASDSTGDSSSRMKIHFLDMGKTKYGDSIVVEVGAKRVLIDGGHPGDYADRNGHLGIPSQLEKIFGQQPPFKFSLLVVTHCHSDHIGCLPRLVRERTVEAEWALVADENLGFARTSDDSANPLFSDGVTEAMRQAVAALAEEDPGVNTMSDAELAEFIADAATLESNYREMLGILEGRGTRVVRYGVDDHSELAEEFSGIGMKILGPTTEHLLICAETIDRFNRDAVDLLVGDSRDEDLPDSAVTIYRDLQQSSIDAADMPGVGAAKNNQSIVLSFDNDGWKALLAGDMQFAKAEVDGLDDDMDSLRQAIKEEPAFDLVKLSHHSSYNGVDESTIKDFGAKVLVHTGGWNDPGHPSSTVLRILRRRRNELTWARTDKNGRVTATRKHRGVHLSIEKGSLNNGAANRPSDASEPVLPAPVLTVKPTLGEQYPVASSTHAPVLPEQPDVVEVTARVPHRTTRVVVTIDVQPGQEAQKKSKELELVDQSRRLANGRQLPRLLFVTNRTRLAENIGASEADEVVQIIRNAGQPVIEDCPFDVVDAGRVVKKKLAELATVAGVVLVGGYDVIAAQRLDVLPPRLRQSLRNPAADHDQFIVWSDDFYGCVDDDDVPDLPISRIPDGKSSGLVLQALCVGEVGSKSRFGVRNLARPFAENIFAKIHGQGDSVVSERFAPANLHSRPDLLRADRIYLMLHGADWDATRFWGETQARELYEAINLSSIPKDVSATVFTGCCWGAMPVNRRACQAVDSAQAGPRTTSDSLALSFLQAGAKAFVGCTGVHYSPTTHPFDFFGGPFHEAFWRQLARVNAPARALFEAKKEYLRGIPHRRNGSPSAVAQDEAIELKIMRQYTCLGLGW